MYGCLSAVLMFSLPFCTCGILQVTIPKGLKPAHDACGSFAIDIAARGKLNHNQMDTFL